MDVKAAKDISILTYLQHIGHYPVKFKKAKDEFCFVAPYRDEKDGSLWVNSIKNCWKDFGSGQGGNIIDLVMLINKCDVSTALQKFDTVPQIRFSSFRQQEDFKNVVEIKHQQSLQNKALIEYLQERKVNIDIAKLYLSEIYYTINNKKYFALAFKNRKGGFEIRNKYFKGSTSPKFLTVIKGETEQYNVFEGFIDYLSCLTFYKTNKLKFSTIILNSLSFLNEVIKLEKPLNSFLDNDTAGREAVMILKEKVNVKDVSSFLYPDYKDFNDFICKI